MVKSIKVGIKKYINNTIYSMIVKYDKKMKKGNLSESPVISKKWTCNSGKFIIESTYRAD